MTSAPATPWKAPVVPIREDREIRCPDCGHLLMKGELGSGARVQLKCTRTSCKRIVSFARM
jgi:hypothetical protein